MVKNTSCLIQPFYQLRFKGWGKRSNSESHHHHQLRRLYHHHGHMEQMHIAQQSREGDTWFISSTMQTILPALWRCSTYTSPHPIPSTYTISIKGYFSSFDIHHCIEGGGRGLSGWVNNFWSMHVTYTRPSPDMQYTSCILSDSLKLKQLWKG